MTSLSTHVLDTELGQPAAGVPVALYHDAEVVATAMTAENGRVPELASSLTPGVYRLVFDVAVYLTAHGRPAPFLQRVSLEVTLDGAESHYHVPLLMTPYACTTYRGS